MSESLRGGAIAEGSARDGYRAMGQYVVYRDEGDRWIAAHQVGAPAIENSSSPRSSREAIDLLRQHLAAKGETVTTVTQGGGVFHVSSTTERDPIPYDITLKLSAMPEVARLLEELSATLHKSSAETIIQALVMLKVIVDAGKQGKRLVITDEDLDMEREILVPGRSHDRA